ncbi:hypothetical protein [Pedobacter sp. Leaf250]|uniref:hypothetical protein n=1 Tax=Pedobacter sp. Leaf250 TaxID=2876559 RepID=UPI001E3767B8|nr:hypothetical protein [Pedobacter sp. Leaf250]
MAHYVRVEPYFILSDTNRFGGFLVNSLKHKRHIKENDLIINLTGETLTVSIGEYYERNYGILISKTHQARFNKFLFDDFNDRMFDYVLPRLTGKKGDIRKALLSFRDKYSISEDELGFTTLKKQYERMLMYSIREKTA